MFSRTTKLKIDKALYERVVRAAAIAGYSSVDEFVSHVLEKEAARHEGAADDADVEKRLRGLGYIE